MPIEFQCRRCGKLLQTPEEAAGKQAKCPVCEEVQPIPEKQDSHEEAKEPADPGFGEALAATAPGSPFAQPTAASAESGQTPTNPYQPPGAYFGSSPFSDAGPGEYRPTIIDLGDCFSRAWAIFADQWGMCFAIWLVAALINFGFGYLSGILSAAIAMGGQLGQVEAAIIDWGLTVIVQVLGIWINIGQLLLFLRISRGQPADFGVLFSGGPYLLRFVIATVLFMLIILAGLLLFIVPAIVFALMFGQFSYLILDRNLGPVEAFNESRRITQGNKMTVLAIFLLLCVLSLAAVLTCGLGFLVLGPYSCVLFAVIYLRMTGQHIASPM